MRPARWIVIENGSTDATPDVAAQLAEHHDWISVVSAPPGPPNLRGATVVRALHAGIAALEQPLSFVAKVDAVGPKTFHMDVHLIENRFEFARALRPDPDAR